MFFGRLKVRGLSPHTLKSVGAIAPIAPTVPTPMPLHGYFVDQETRPSAPLGVHSRPRKIGLRDAADDCFGCLLRKFLTIYIKHFAVHYNIQSMIIICRKTRRFEAFCPKRNHVHVHVTAFPVI